MSNLLKRRIDRLEARAGLDDISALTAEELLVVGARRICGMSLSEIRDLNVQPTNPHEQDALSEQQQLALAIVSAEIEVMDTLSKVHNDGSTKEVKSIEEMFTKVYAEWQHMRATQMARGFEIGRPAPGWLADNMFGG